VTKLVSKASLWPILKFAVEQVGRVPQAFLPELVVGEHSDRKPQLTQ
jgi:hypothetical protein